MEINEQLLYMIHCKNENRHKIIYNTIPFIESSKTSNKNPTLFWDAYIGGTTIKKSKVRILCKSCLWLSLGGWGSYALKCWELQGW